VGTIFLVWGVGGKGGQKTYAIKVNDHVIGYAEYKKEYENISNSFKQIFGSDVDPKLLSNQVLNEIISNTCYLMRPKG